MNNFSISKKHKRILTVFILALIIMTSVPKLGLVFAQRNVNIHWHEPVNLSNSASSSTYPAVAADKYGYVHVFWGEDLDGEPVSDKNQSEYSNSIAYTYWDGTNWSTPIDLFYSSGSSYNFPSVTIDQIDILHLVWKSNQGIYYSSVPLNLAHIVKNWSIPQIVAKVHGDGPQIFSDNENNLHLIYTSWNNLITGKHDGNVYYQKSMDSGKNWSEAVQLSSIIETSDINAAHPSTFIDSSQYLHTTWFQASPPGYTGDSVHYSRSVDGGQSWSPAEIVYEKKEGENWTSMPEIVGKNKELHQVWVCGTNAHRCHRWSKDGGDTWLTTKRVFGEMVSLAGWDTLVYDGEGTLYWILQLRYPPAIYFSVWTGADWSGLSVVEDKDLSGGHYLRAAVHNSNQINLVMVHQLEKEIWYKLGETNSSPIAPIPKPRVANLEIIPVTPTVTLSTQEIMPQGEFNNNSQPISNLQSGNNFLWISIIPVVALIILIILIKSRIIHNK
jgi:hypothetical protein